MTGVLAGNPRSVSAQTTLGGMSIGQIFQIAPNAGTYMCGTYTCSSNGAAAEPYKLMYSGLSDGATRGFIMVDNYCAWRSADCTYAYYSNITPNYWYGTSWNSGPGSTIISNNLGGNRQPQNILIQLENFYNSLPATIGGVAKDTAIPSRTFNMIGIPFTSGTGAISSGNCRTSTNSTPYGNIGATFVGTIGTTGTCTMTSRVSLPSYEEWLGGLYGYGYYPPSGTLGYAFCQARYGAAGCNVAGTDLSTGASLAAYGLFNTNATIKRPYQPWLRSPESSYTTFVFHVGASGTTRSLYNDDSIAANGVLPWLYFQSSIPIESGAGTYASPYELGIPNTTPTITIANPAGNPWRSNVSGYTNITVSGNVTDPDNQTQTIQYQIDGGTWTTGQTLAAGTGTRSYSFSVNVSGLAEGNHTVKTRTYDGVAYSAETTTLSFRLDKTIPICGSWNTPTWTNTSSVTMTLSSSTDAHSGINTAGGTCTVTTNGGTCNVTISDQVGNTRTCTSNAALIDTTPPTFTLSPTPTGTSSWTTSTSLTITPSDTGGSGVAETRYSTTNNLNSACTSGGTVGTSLTLSAGTNNIYVCVRDNAGNVSTSAAAYNAANVYQVNRDATQPTPDPTVENSADPSIGAFASYNTGFDSLVLAGTVNDADSGQTLTIQYQIDSTAGSWSNLTTLTANGSNQPWSGTVNLPSGLTAGSHTIYIRVYDGYSYSANKSVSFILDLSAPTNTVSLVGGVLCTGITTIYCTAPTGINLSTSSDGSGAGIGAYRTQWDTVFAAGDVSPSWVTGTPPSNLTTTGHTIAAATHTLYYQTRDTVGNVSAVESISYYVNSTPEVEINDANHNQVITPYTPLVLSGTFTDLDSSQSVTIKATINGIDYVSQTYPTTSSVVAWEIVIPASSLLGLSPSQLTNFPLTITDSAGVSSIAYYTGQISVSSSTSSEIYLSVIKNIPFALTIGKVGAINVTFGTNQGITVSTNSSDEIIVSGSLASPVSIPFGVTDLVFTVLEEPSFEVQNIEFV